MDIVCVFIPWIRSSLLQDLLFVFFLLSIQVISANTVITIHDGSQSYFGYNDDFNDPDPKYRIIPGDQTTYGCILFSYSNNWSRTGMNEKGVSFAWLPNDDESHSWIKDSNKKDFNGNLSEKILSQSSSIGEVLAYYKTFNDPSFDQSYVVWSDSTGQTAFITNEGDSMAVTLCRGVCIGGLGYQPMVDKLSKHKADLDKNEIINLLNVGHQEEHYPTMFTVLYDMKALNVDLYFFHSYDQAYKIDLTQSINEPSEAVLLSSIFSTTISSDQLEQLKSGHFYDQLKSIPIKGWLMLSVLLTLIVLCPIVLYMFFKKLH